MTDQEKIDLLAMKPAILAFFAELETEFIDRIKAGEEIEGVIAVKKRCQRRLIEDESSVFRVCSKYLTSRDIYELKPKSLTHLKSALTSAIQLVDSDLSKKAVRSRADELLHEITMRKESDEYKILLT